MNAWMGSAQGGAKVPWDPTVIIPLILRLQATTPLHLEKGLRTKIFFNLYFYVDRLTI